MIGQQSGEQTARSSAADRTEAHDQERPVLLRVKRENQYLFFPIAG